MNSNYSLEPVDFDPFNSENKSVASTQAQREIFTSVKIGGAAANCAYNESVNLVLHGKVDLIKLQSAFNKVILRHDALRATFNDDGTIIRFNNTSIPLSITDLTSISATDKIVYLENIKREEVLDPFDLETGPLVRASVFVLANDEALLTVTGHHIVCDGWSLSLLLKDLSAIYSAEVLNKNAGLNTAISFADYAQKQVTDNLNSTHKTVEEFWLKQFTGELPVINFPTDKPRPALRTFKAHRIDVKVDPEIVIAVRQFSKKLGTSFVTTMLAAFETFLYKSTGQKELVVGLPAAGQNAEGYYELIGHCVNLLPLRTSLNPSLSFTEYLKQRKAYLFDAFDHQQFTFGSLLQKLNIQRDASRIPLVPIVFNVDIGFTEGFHFEGLNFDFSTNPRSYENFEIFLNASGSGDQLVLECTFNTDLFEEQMMELRMLEFISILKQISNNPDIGIAEIEGRTAMEIALHRSINDTEKKYPSEIGLHELIRKKAAKYPGNIAISCHDRDYTYEQLEAYSNRLAAILQNKGITTGDLIGVCMLRTAELPIVLIAVLKAGASYVPLDPAFPKERIAMMVEDAKLKLIISSNALAHAFNFPREKLVHVDDALLRSTNGIVYTPVTCKKDQLAYILFTSGSTGRPKGVAVKHQSVVNLLLDLKDRFSFESKDILLAVTTISFDISVLEIFLPLISGGRIHMASKEQSMDAAWLDRIIKNDPVTFMQATPATWELLLASGWKGASHLNVLCGGEALRVDLAKKLLENNFSLWNLYGPTETTIWSMLKKVEPNDFSTHRNGVITIGKPVANTSLYCMDESGKLCPIGIPGELWIGGDGVAAGYLYQPEMTAEKFVPNPLGKGLVYKTGDRVVMNALGNYYFLNRFDHQVKVRGYRIELGEIESLINTCNAIRQGVVITKQHPEGEHYLVAYFIPVQNNSAATKEEIKISIIQDLRSILSKKLPDYMIPTNWVMLESFPLTPNGKVDRKILPEPFAEENSQVGLKYELMTKIQITIARVWMNLLTLPDIGTDDDFFELGGHSLLAVRMMVDLEKETGIKLPLAVLFSNPTIRQLAVLYEAPPQNELWNPLVKIKESGNRNPIYFAHGISGNVFKYHALATMLHPEQPSYGLQAVGLNGKEKPFTDMESMATFHVNEILKFQPEGPYALAGGSFGGYLAYEMACQLEAMGKKVNFLCLFDIEAGTVLDFLPSTVKHLKKVQLIADRITKRAVSFIKADSKGRQAYLQARRKISNQESELESWLDKHKIVDEIGEESATYFRQVEDACYKALLSYKIKNYGGNIMIVRAQDGFFNNTYARDLGWSHFVNGSIDVSIVAGDHNSIFWEPNVNELAHAVQNILSQRTESRQLL